MYKLKYKIKVRNIEMIRIKNMPNHIQWFVNNFFLSSNQLSWGYEVESTNIAFVSTFIDYITSYVTIESVLANKNFCKNCIHVLINIFECS